MAKQSKTTAPAVRLLPATETRQMVSLGDVVIHQQELERNPERAGFERYLMVDNLDADRLHISRWGLIADGDLPPTFYKVFRAGQVLYPTRNPHLRRVAYADFNGICGEKTLTLESNGKVEPRLLPFVFQTEGFIAHASSMAIGSTNPHVRWRDIAAYKFWLPRQNEQRRIADILWSVDDAIEQYRAAEHQACELLESLRREVFRQHFKIGRTCPLSQVGEWRSGGTPSRSKAELWNGDFPWVSPKDMKVEEIQGSVEHLTADGKSAASVVPSEAILIVIRGMILAHTFPVAITKREVAFNQDMKAIVVSDAFDPLYVYHWLRSQATTVLGLVADSSHGTKRLPMERVLSLRIPSPDLQSQSKAVRLFQTTGNTRLQLKAHVDLLRQLKSQLMHKLFAPGGAA